MDVGILDTTVLEEKTFNPRLTKTKEEFVEIMNNLNLAYPAQIGNNSFIMHVFIIILFYFFFIMLTNFLDKALPANKVCGLYNLPPEMEEKYKSVLKP